MTDFRARDDPGPAESREPGGPRDRGGPARAAARRRVERRRIALLVGAVGIVVVAGVALGYDPPAWLVEAPEPPPGRHTLGLVLVAVGFVAATVALVRAHRARALRLVWNSPTALLSRVERKRLLRRIRADEGVDLIEQEGAVALAEQLTRQRALLPAYGAMMLYFVGRSRVTSSPLTRWPLVVTLVLFAVGLPLVARDCRRARTWLDHHGSDDA